MSQIEYRIVQKFCDEKEQDINFFVQAWVEDEEKKEMVWKDLERFSDLDSAKAMMEKLKMRQGIVVA